MAALPFTMRRPPMPEHLQAEWESEPGSALFCGLLFALGGLVPLALLLPVTLRDGIDLWIVVPLVIAAAYGMWLSAWAAQARRQRRESDR